MLAGLSLAAVADTSAADTPATFSVLNSDVQPLSWTSTLIVRVVGFDARTKVAGNWHVSLNGVPFKVTQTFVSPEPEAPMLNSAVQLVLNGPDFTADKAAQQDSNTTAAAIRLMAPDRWGTNSVVVQVACDGAVLTPAMAPDGKTMLRAASFELISRARGFVCLVTLAVLVWVFYWAGARTGALRDPSALNPDFHQRTFSLARTQLAFWTVIVVASFLYIYLITGVFSGVLNETALWLLGISSTTSALSLAAGNSGGNAGQPAPPPVAQRTSGFLADILGDSQGVNVHRLQMVIWTAVFGGVLVTRVLTGLAFPVFDKTTYALMGISSGTYIWFKQSET